MKVGFIGLGIMGRPMAGHLAKAGHELYVHDLRCVPHLRTCSTKGPRTAVPAARWRNRPR
jgi:3-hydroxyisobutyrate dehydrogenase-like beta-hydroxyacid dehydrogenase